MGSSPITLKQQTTKAYRSFDTQTLIENWSRQGGVSKQHIYTEWKDRLTDGWTDNSIL